MQLYSEQIRRYYLAGAVPLPAPFPKVGTISIESDAVYFPPGDTERSTTFVVVQATQGLRRASIHLIDPCDVAAIFVPYRFILTGAAEGGEGGPPPYQCAPSRRRIDFDEGLWFLTPDINAEALAGHLPFDAEQIKSRNSPLRGIVFVRKQARILTLREIGHTAAQASRYATAYGCDCDCYSYGCDADYRPSWCDCD